MPPNFSSTWSGGIYISIRFKLPKHPSEQVNFNVIFQFQFVDGVKSNRGSGIGIDLDLGVPAGVGLNKSSDGSSDGTGKLVHLTASRVKAPKRRPPSQAFLKDVVRM